jgi:restriction system protein
MINSQQAFATLLEQLDVALQESLARSNRAAQQGDFDAVEIEVERQRNLVSARNQLQTLQELWPGLVGESKKTEKKSAPVAKRSSRAQRLPKGSATSRKAFRLPILAVLEEMGGSGRMADVLNRVGEMMAHILNETDRGLTHTGQTVRWRHAAQWVRQRMKDEGLLAADSPHGIWEITEMGHAYLREHQEELLTMLGRIPSHKIGRP